MRNLGPKGPPFGPYEGQKPRNLAVLEMRGFLRGKNVLLERKVPPSAAELMWLSILWHEKEGISTQDLAWLDTERAPLEEVYGRPHEPDPYKKAMDYVKEVNAWLDEQEARLNQQESDEQTSEAPSPVKEAPGQVLARVPSEMDGPQEPDEETRKAPSPAEETPGQVLARVLLEQDGPRRVWLLRAVEKQALETADMEMLRAIREYQAEARRIRPLKDI